MPIEHFTVDCNIRTTKVTGAPCDVCHAMPYERAIEIVTPVSRKVIVYLCEECLALWRRQAVESN